MRSNLRDGRNFPYWRASNAMIDDGHLKNMGCSAWAVYCVLARHANNNEKDQAFPSFNYLQEVTGFSRATVTKAIAHLLKLGYLTKVHEGKSRGDSNIYELNDENQIKIQTSSKNELVQNLDTTSSKNEPVLVQKMNQLGGVTSSKNEPYKDQEKNNIKRTIDKPEVANVSEDDFPSLPETFALNSSAPSTNSPEDTGEQANTPTKKDIPPSRSRYAYVNKCQQMDDRFNGKKNPWDGDRVFAEWLGKQWANSKDDDKHPRVVGEGFIINAEELGGARLKKLERYWGIYCESSDSSASEDVMKALGREMHQRNLSCELPSDWKKRTGKILVSELSASEASSYLAYLRSQGGAA